MENTQILLGYSRKDISPDFPHNLSGYGDDPTRPMEGILDRVYGTCLAITDAQGQTALLYSLDLLLVNVAGMEALRPGVSGKTGIPDTHIFFAATHTHAGPTLNTSVPSTQRYIEFLTQQLCLAAEEALADRVPAQMLMGGADTEKLNFVRHYITSAGTYMGDNFGDRVNPVVAHTAPADTRIQLVRFVRDGKADVILMNWQAHGKMSSTINSEFGRTHRRHLSADFIGYTRDALEQETDALVIYFSGAAGNLNPDSRIEAEMPTKDPAEFGAQLAQTALKGLENMQPISGGAVRCSRKTLWAAIDHSDDDKISIAKEVWDMWSKDQEKCRELAAKHGFHSPFDTRAIINRYNSGDRKEIELNTLTIGQLAFAAAPYEMFCENGKHIKESAPFPMTVILSCCNGYHSYLASDRTFEHGGYEVSSRNYVRGTAEKMAQALVEMLHSN